MTDDRDDAGERVGHRGGALPAATTAASSRVERPPGERPDDAVGVEVVARLVLTDRRLRERAEDAVGREGGVRDPLGVQPGLEVGHVAAARATAQRPVGRRRAGRRRGRGRGTRGTAGDGLPARRLRGPRGRAFDRRRQLDRGRPRARGARAGVVLHAQALDEQLRGAVAGHALELGDRRRRHVAGGTGRAVDDRPGLGRGRLCARAAATLDGLGLPGRMRTRHRPSLRRATAPGHGSARSRSGARSCPIGHDPAAAPGGG